jgi:hypothetical protein
MYIDRSFIQEVNNIARQCEVRPLSLCKHRVCCLPGLYVPTRQRLSFSGEPRSLPGPCPLPAASYLSHSSPQPPSSPAALPPISCSPGCPPLALVRAQSSVLFLSDANVSSPACCDATRPLLLLAPGPGHIPNSPTGVHELCLVRLAPPPFIFTDFPARGLPIALMREAVQTSETSVTSHHSTLRYNPAEGHLHTCHREKVKLGQVRLAKVRLGQFR